MLALSIFYGLLAGVVSLVTAQATTYGVSTRQTSGSRYTTSTSTLTKTVTITMCNPSISNCPGHTTSAAPTAPTVSLSTDLPTLYPTSGLPFATKNSTSYYQPSVSPSSICVSPSGPLVTQPSATQPPSTYAPVPSGPIPTGAASSVVLQNGLMLGALVAGIAILA